MEQAKSTEAMYTLYFKESVPQEFFGWFICWLLRYWACKLC